MFTLHHIGYTVADMQATIQQFATFGYQADLSSMTRPFKWIYAISPAKER